MSLALNGFRLMARRGAAVRVVAARLSAPIGVRASFEPMAMATASVPQRAYAKKSRKGGKGGKRDDDDDDAGDWDTAAEAAVAAFEEEAAAALEALQKALRGVQARRACELPLPHGATRPPHSTLLTQRWRAYCTAPELLNSVQVDGAPLIAVAHIGVRDARTLLVRPHDSAKTNDIVNAINTGTLGLNASIEGTAIRVPVPRPSDEFRTKLRRNIALADEQAVRRVRLARQTALKSLKKERDGAPKDDVKRTEKDLDQRTTKATAALNDLAAKKIKEIETDAAT